MHLYVARIGGSVFFIERSYCTTLVPRAVELVPVDYKCLTHFLLNLSSSLKVSKKYTSPEGCVGGTKPPASSSSALADTTDSRTSSTAHTFIAQRTHEGQL